MRIFDISNSTVSFIWSKNVGQIRKSWNSLPSYCFFYSSNTFQSIHYDVVILERILTQNLLHFHMVLQCDQKVWARLLYEWRLFWPLNDIFSRLVYDVFSRRLNDIFSRHLYDVFSRRLNYVFFWLYFFATYYVANRFFFRTLILFKNSFTWVGDESSYFRPT